MREMIERFPFSGMVAGKSLSPQTTGVCQGFTPKVLYTGNPYY